MARSRKTLHLDRENRKFLGVCAGVANFLDVEPTSVRLVFLGCLIFGGWFLVPLYFIVWFLLDDASAGMRSSITDNHMVNHFRSVDYKKKLYRNAEEGKILGVCAGIADYLEVSVFAVRICFLAMIFLTGIPLLFYFLAALVLDTKPPTVHEAAGVRYDPRPGETGGAEHEREAGGTADFASEQFSKRREFQYCARKFATLQARLARLEAYVTSSRFKLHQEFKNIS